VMLMFGICLLHAVGFGGHGQAWVINILSSCVVGFVFISGWFGVRFSWGLPIPCAWFAAALAVFASALAADFPRRAFAWLLRQR